ncbi:hypothetical protein E2562_002068 [Oryza meyeriana var. granulata]|uniref:Uncharacterized protein n=1 Tax=Oryza meyeriana var. granulata TaxID=110450 RepID=A0A6G1EDF8_9ORYZ|nr:hypothetical protein E2562_002068 [Oryza meyeriana var. granulata]
MYAGGEKQWGIGWRGSRRGRGASPAEAAGSAVDLRLGRDVFPRVHLRLGRVVFLRLPAAASCWGNGAVVEGIGGRRGRSRRERAGDNGGGGEDGPGAAAARAPAAAWCCVCPDEDCRLEANPSANGKEDPGLRSLLEHNDFFSDDCNPHAAAFPEPGDRSD